MITRIIHAKLLNYIGAINIAQSFLNAELEQHANHPGLYFWQAIILLKEKQSKYKKSAQYELMANEMGLTLRNAKPEH